MCVPIGTGSRFANSVCGVLVLQSSYYSKLEKADILEMTVKYLNSLKRQRITGNVQITAPFDSNTKLY